MTARARAPHPANASRQSGATTKLTEEPIIRPAHACRRFPSRAFRAFRARIPAWVQRQAVAPRGRREICRHNGRRAPARRRRCGARAVRPPVPNKPEGSSWPLRHFPWRKPGGPPGRSKHGNVLRRCRGSAAAGGVSAWRAFRPVVGGEDRGERHRRVWSRYKRPRMCTRRSNPGTYGCRAWNPRTRATGLKNCFIVGACAESPRRHPRGVN